MSERSVRRSIRELEERGLVETSERRNEKGRQTSHNFRLIGLPGQNDRPARDDDSGRTDCPPSARSRADKLTASPGQIDRLPRTDCPPTHPDKLSAEDLVPERVSETRVGGQIDRPPLPARSRGYTPIEITEEIRDRLLALIEPEAYDAWIVDPGTRFELNGSALRVVASSSFIANWFRSNFEEALRQVFERDAITYRVETAA